MRVDRGAPAHVQETERWPNWTTREGGRSRGRDFVRRRPAVRREIRASRRSSLRLATLYSPMLVGQARQPSMLRPLSLQRLRAGGRWLASIAAPPPGLLKLRPYQKRAIDAAREMLAAEMGNPLVVLPPGTGKSLLVAELIRSAREANPGARVVVLTASKELVVQNVDELRRLCEDQPGATSDGILVSLSIYNAALKRKEAKGMVIFGTIQSMYNKFEELVPPPPPDLLIVDEAHLIPRRGDSMFGRFIFECTAANEDLQIVGLTATPFRLDSGLLTEDFREEDALFDLAYEYTHADAVADGWLCPLVSKEAGSALDVSNVKRRGNDFDDEDLKALLRSHDTGGSVGELIRRGAERDRWLVFCSGADHTVEVRDELQRVGVACEAILGDTPGAQRDEAIEAFKSGTLRALVNNIVLTTGFNVPAIDLVALMRPTLSSGLYVQMVGRGARIAEGKRDCLVLDFGGNIRRHGLLEDLRVRTPAEAHEVGDGPPLKTCASCYTMNAIARQRCTQCDAPFKTQADRLTALPSPLKLHQLKHSVARFRVDDVRFQRNERPGGIPTLQVTYYCMDPERQDGRPLTRREWICVQHRDPHDARQSYALKKAREWWRARGGGEPPSTVDEALRVASTLWKPSHVDVESGQFASITPQGLAPQPGHGAAAMLNAQRQQQPSPGPKPKANYYGVRGDSKAGVYHSWEHAKAASVPGAIAKKFATEADARAFVSRGRRTP